MIRNLLIIFATLMAGATAHGAPPAAAVHRAGMPDVHIVISAGTLDAASRKLAIETIGRVLRDAFKTTESAPGDFGFDVSVARLLTTRVDGHIEILAEVHVVISDGAGRMLSYLSGGAKIQPPPSYRPKALPSLENQALEDATVELVGPLRTRLLHLAARRTAPST